MRTQAGLDENGPRNMSHYWATFVELFTTPFEHGPLIWGIVPLYFALLLNEVTSAKANLKLLQREEATKKEWEKKQKKAAGDAERAGSDLARLCREAGAVDAPSARTVCDRANRRRELEKRLTGYQEGLSMVCGSRTIEEFQILGMARKAGSRVLPVDRLVRGA